MKKIVTVLLASFLVFSAVAADIQISLMPHFDIASGIKHDSMIGGTIGLTVAPIAIRRCDDIYFGFEGTGGIISAKGIDPVYALDGSLAIGYNFRISDRWSVNAQGLVGLWMIPQSSTNKNRGKSIAGASGIAYGGSIAGNYYFFPEFQAFASVGYKSYSYKPKSILDIISIGVGVKYNITKGLLSTSNVTLVDYEISPLFPVFYSRYDENEFGRVSFVSNERTDITDVQVSVYIPQYMSNPKEIYYAEKISPDEEFSADLTAFLSETILDSLQTRMADATVTVTYKALGKSFTYSENIPVQTLTRNSMSWEDDRRAATFVSAKDASALRFAKILTKNVKDSISGSRPENLQYAAALFAALKVYGINYVVDPASAFTDNTGTSSVDFLQFPYQTLLYHGGDCDDLTILNCSILEAMGIDTAFITVPGHIYMAFDSGVSPDLADAKLGKGKYIIKNGKAWIPVEITVSQDSFQLALQLGLSQWKKHGENAVLIPLEEAWAVYKPVTTADSEVKIQLPSKEAILKEFRKY